MDTVGNILAWALCGGILVAVILVWLYVFIRLLWGSIRKRQADR